MSLGEIVFREGADIPPHLLQQLFRQEQFSDFLELDEIRIHLDSALYVVSAWHGQELVGYARLEGDGRISVQISDVLVKSEYRGIGIGTALVKRLVMRIEELDPYFIQVEPIDDRAAHLYAKFGFREFPNYRRMELITDKLTRKVAKLRGNKDAPGQVDRLE